MVPPEGGVGLGHAEGGDHFDEEKYECEVAEGEGSAGWQVGEDGDDDGGSSEAELEDDEWSDAEYRGKHVVLII